MMRASALCAGLFLTLIPALPLHAYRNPARFAASVDEGGGGGKYFTLSRAEGYGCAVCHSQGTPVPLEVRNLPVSGFLPSQTYRITIDWPDDVPSVALNVEVTDNAGAPYGQLFAPDPSTLSAADLCPQSDATEPPTAAQTLQMDAAARRVLLVAECGQAQTSFDWIAPLVPAQGYFSSSIIFTNRDGKLTGDNVVDVVEPLNAQATNRYEGACSVLGRRDFSARPGGFVAVAACFTCAVILSRRTRRCHARARRL